MARHFTNWLRAYMDWTKLSEAPDVFHFWTGVGTIAGALRSCVWIDELTYTYTPNFFLFFVGPPGIATKSTSIGLGMRLLEKVPEIKFGPSSVTWQKLMGVMKDAVITIKWEDENKVARQRPASAITIEASELGTFLQLEQEGLAERLIDLWDGKISKRGMAHATLGGGTINVENPWIHVIGATTPSWLNEHFHENMMYGGLASRILFIYGDKKRQLIAYPSQVIKPVDFAAKELQLVQDLTEISKLRGPMVFTTDARKWGTDWYVRLHTSAPPAHMASGRFEGYRARKQAWLHKIAIVLSAATREDRVIDEAILVEADAHLTSAELLMMKVFNSIGIVPEAKWVREILAVVQTYTTIYPKGMTHEQIYTLLANVITLRDFNTALLSAVQQNVLERVKLGTKADGTTQYGVKIP